MTTPLLLLLGVGLVYALVCLIGFIAQEKLVYFPDRQLGATPRQIGLEYRDIRFPAADGVELHGWFVPASAETSRFTVLFCHGNAGNISHRLDSLRLLHDLGLSVLIFDYRGYGQSAGRVGERGTYRDAEGAWSYLVETLQVAPGEIIVLGRSLGGAVAIELASRRRPRALIAESTFTSVPELGARVYPWLPVRQLARIRYESAERIGRIRCPLLMVHSLDDEVVPYVLGLRLFRAAKQPKQLLKIRGAHGDGFLTAGDRYTTGLRDFLDTLAE